MDNKIRLMKLIIQNTKTWIPVGWFSTWPTDPFNDRWLDACTCWMDSTQLT